MIASIKEIVVPQMRERGFRGSFPHFRRRTDRQIDLLTFQFDRNGGGFVIEISRCPPGGITTSWGKEIPPAKVTAQDLHPDERQRLQPFGGGGTDSWFRYDSRPPPSGGFVARFWKILFSSSEPPISYDSVAQSVLPFLDQADEWYAGESSENHK